MSVPTVHYLKLVQMTLLILLGSEQLPKTPRVNAAHCSDNARVSHVGVTWVPLALALSACFLASSQNFSIRQCGVDIICIGSFAR